ncbi:hypothetical protein ZWY2020_037432 [Hordeum vulgare]|nr:hypothetical protein ZWY2020_037432 [Hordeum vulgare]
MGVPTGQGGPRNTTPEPPSTAPPPRDPDRDPRLPLPGSPGDIRRQEAARSSISDVDHEAALRAELVARPPPVSRPRDEPAPRAPPARAPAHRSSASTWRRDRQDHRRDEWRGAPHMRRGDEDRSWRSSRAKGADWRRDVDPPRRVSPEAPPVAPMPVPAPAKKKKKSKKKKAVLCNSQGLGCPACTGALSRRLWISPLGLVVSAPVRTRCASTVDALPVGKLITADLASFEDDGPARIEILCPARAEIDGLSLVFNFGTKGRRLTFEIESSAPVDPLGPAEAVQAGGRALRRRRFLLR